MTSANQGRNKTGNLRLRDAFVERFGVKPFSRRYRNVQGLLKQGGAGNDQVKAILRWRFDASTPLHLGSCSGRGRPFDHAELWGRHGVPLFLIGHPYHLDDEALATLAAIRSLGMVVSDYHPGWYGHCTHHIRVYHPQTVLRVTAKGFDVSASISETRSA
jgi:hypothetical protein